MTTDDYGEFVLSYQLYGSLLDGPLYMGQVGHDAIEALEWHNERVEVVPALQRAILTWLAWNLAPSSTRGQASRGSTGYQFEYDSA